MRTKLFILAVVSLISISLEARPDTTAVANPDTTAVTSADTVSATAPVTGIDTTAVANPDTITVTNPDTTDVAKPDAITDTTAVASTDSVSVTVPAASTDTTAVTRTEPADTAAVQPADTVAVQPADTTELRYELEGTTLTVNGTTQTADRRTFTFTAEDRQRVYSSLELMATLPGLRNDLVAGGIKSTDGSSILILINGVKATDEEIKALPKNKIKSVDYYDIPPARYAQNEVDKVINIVTAPLDDGFILDISGDYGLTSHFSDDDIYFAWNKGRSKLSVSYSFSWRDVPDRQVEQTYNYTLGNTEYSLHYLEKNHFGYEDHDPIVKYSYVNNDKTIIEITAKPGYNHWYSLCPDGTGEYTEGDGDPRPLTTVEKSIVNTFSPSLDAYLYQRLSKKDELSVNLVGTYYNVKQPVGVDQQYFTDEEDADSTLFDDIRNLRNTKWSFIGEVAYTRKVLGSANWNTGYRVNASFLHSTDNNSFGDFDYRSRFITHYAYTEVSGTWKDLTYRVSLGLNCTDNTADGVHVKNVNFTPRVIVGYNLPKNNSLRLQYVRTPSSPDINDLSSNISYSAYNIISTGNPSLQNSVRQQISLTYNYSNDYIDLSLMPYYLHTKRPFVRYYEEGTSPVDGSPVYWSLKDNGTYIRSGGAQLTVDITPFGNDMLILEGYFWPHRTAVHSDHWDYALTSLGNYLGLEFNWKWFTLDYQLNFPVFDLSGSYLTTDENANHLALQFKIKNWMVSASCLWIGKGAHYETESVPSLPVQYTAVTDFFDQENLVLIGLSYHFQSGKDKSYSRRLSNADYASPTK